MTSQDYNLLLPRVKSSSGKCSLTFVGPKVCSTILDCIKSSANCTFKSVVPKLGVNYSPGVICDSLVGNAEPKPQFCSVL